jgi:hypothetical protein
VSRLAVDVRRRGIDERVRRLDRDAEPAPRDQVDGLGERLRHASGRPGEPDVGLRRPTACRAIARFVVDAHALAREADDPRAAVRDLPDDRGGLGCRRSADGLIAGARTVR